MGRLHGNSPRPYPRRHGVGAGRTTLGKGLFRQHQYCDACPLTQRLQAWVSAQHDTRWRGTGAADRPRSHRDTTHHLEECAPTGPWQGCVSLTHNMKRQLRNITQDPLLGQSRGRV